MINVAILLSTYNGEKFLEEQIDSILLQSYKNWSLYIRDDGSSDNTINIINTYTKNNTNIHFINDTKRKGACMSFMWLLNEINSDYYMFCDQDDVWLPNKIEISINTIIAAEKKSDIPIILHTDLIIVDKEKRIISNSFWKYTKLKQNYLSQFNYLGVCNGVTGCTMMLNNKAKQIAFPISSKAPMHDYWIALKVSQSGKIIYLDTPTILYRQHGKNEVGAKSTDSGYFFARLKKIKQTLSNQLNIYIFLKDLPYGSLLKFYWYKITYTIIRNI